jgi:hypothetical protein
MGPHQERDKEEKVNTCKTCFYYKIKRDDWDDVEIDKTFLFITYKEWIKKPNGETRGRCFAMPEMAYTLSYRSECSKYKPHDNDGQPA